MSEQDQIQQTVTGTEYAATSGTGNASITITNYYYREEARVVPSDVNVLDKTLPCPYRGLFHFGPNDADVFFGRKTFIEELYQATQKRNFIPLLGASGSGKSSVVLAGLVPKLEEVGNWKFTHFRPSEGDDLFHALALALVPLLTPQLVGDAKLKETRDMAKSLREEVYPISDIFTAIKHNYPQHRILLIADQFEELYAPSHNETIRRKFLDCLVSLVTPSASFSSSTVLVTTMRADFLGNALSYRPFADILQNADCKLGPMNREELREIIEKPANSLEVRFQEGLVESILDDVEKEPGSLPLLEFALTQLWNKRTCQELTHKVYEEIGQVQGALSRHADEKYSHFTEPEKEKVRRIFIQLVRPGEGTEDTRRIAIKEELGEQNGELVKELADARLIVTSSNVANQETVEVVHEALIRNWGELRKWMETDRVFRAWQERLRAAKIQWETTQKDTGSLLRGAALAEAEEQLKKRPEELSNEQEFINQSIKERQRNEQEMVNRRRREMRTAWGIAAGSLVAVMISTGLGLMAWKQTQQAQLNLANARGFSSLTLFNEGKELEAFIEAIKAGKTLQKQRTYDKDVMNALQELLNQKSEYHRLEGHDNYVNSVSFSPDGKTLASGSADKTIKLWSRSTGWDLDALMGRSCAWVRAYLKNNINVAEEDKHLCD